MRTVHFTLFASLMALVPGQAGAEVIDLSSMTCKQFSDSGREQMAIIVAWLDAFYKDEDDPPLIDTEKFERNARRLGTYCAANPSAVLITATDELFGQ
jgi:acid stress chaperone HdeB